VACPDDLPEIRIPGPFPKALIASIRGRYTHSPVDSPRPCSKNEPGCDSCYRLPLITFMLIRVLKSKLHMATVTQTELSYHGSITIDRDLMEATGLLPYEQVLIGNCSTGQRAETYIIEGEAGSGAMQLNGAMARLAQPGDRIIVLAFAHAEPSEAAALKPKVAVLDTRNQIVEQWEG
jgi:aspartate 1-decarboxylase